MKSDEIKKEFARTIVYAKLTAFLFFILVTPSIVITVKELDGILGMDKQTWFNASVAGFIIYLGFMALYWKCPQCKKFPGRGWFRKECNACGCELS